MTTKRLKGLNRLCVALAVALATVGSVAYATIPDGNTIHGCYERVNGQLRVIDVSDDCRRSELAISWNQQGPKGDRGLQGEAGADGLNGRDGVDGQDGPDGRDGVDGKDGVNGRDGAAGISTATFAGMGSQPVELPANDVWIRVVSKTLPAGSWAATATVNSTVYGPLASGTTNRDLSCELRNGNAFIGGATDRRAIPADEIAKTSLSMNGGAQVPAGGGEVSVWCRSQRIETVNQAQLMILQVGGFS